MVQWKRSMNTVSGGMDASLKIDGANGISYSVPRGKFAYIFFIPNYVEATASLQSIHPALLRASKAGFLIWTKFTVISSQVRVPKDRFWLLVIPNGRAWQRQTQCAAFRNDYDSHAFSIVGRHESWLTTNWLYHIIYISHNSWVMTHLLRYII